MEYIAEKTIGIDMSKNAQHKAANLSFWSSPVEPEPLGGGITNTNFVVRDKGECFVVRIGNDIPLHGVMRFNEIAAARAAHAAGISPEVVYDEPGAFVMRFIKRAYTYRKGHASSVNIGTCCAVGPDMSHGNPEVLSRSGTRLLAVSYLQKLYQHRL